MGRRSASPRPAEPKGACHPLGIYNRGRGYQLDSGGLIRLTERRDLAQTELHDDEM